MSLCTSARIQLGEVGDSDAMQSFALVRQTIDMLDIIESKTRGNLSTDESTLLMEQLSKLKIQFAQSVQLRSAQAIPKQDQ